MRKAALTEQEQSVVILKARDMHCSFADIANEMGVSRQRAHRAFHAGISKLLGAQPEESDVEPNTFTATSPKELHLLFQGLRSALPAPYSDWPEEAQQTWLTTAAQIFRLLYRQNKTPES